MKHEFGGGKFGQDYYGPQGSGFVPKYGPGPYSLGSASYLHGVSTGGLGSAYPSSLGSVYSDSILY